MRLRSWLVSSCAIGLLIWSCADEETVNEALARAMGKPRTELLTWNQNTEDDLAGYRLYRGFDCTEAPLSEVVADDLLETFYSDQFRTKSQQVCYELTAKDLAGNESLHSERAWKQW